MASEDKSAAPEKRAPEKPEYAVIQLPEASREGMPDPLYVAVNGSRYWIRRGNAVPVPLSVVEALKNAKRPKQIQRKEDDGQVRTEYTMIPRDECAFTVLAKIGKAQYEKLRAIAGKRPLTEEEVYA